MISKNMSTSKKYSSMTYRRTCALVIPGDYNKYAEAYRHPNFMRPGAISAELMTFTELGIFHFTLRQTVFINSNFLWKMELCITFCDTPKFA